MTRFRLLYQNGAPVGFEISGHAMTGGAGKDILCAAVSSAAYMTANTITDILRIPADITVSGGLMRVAAAADSPEKVQECKWLLEGLALHMEGLRKEYPENIQIIT